MFKRAFLGSMTLAATTLAAPDASKVHSVDFDSCEFQASGRGQQSLVCTAFDSKGRPAGPTWITVTGPAKLVPGRTGQALDFSDSRQRTEMHLLTGNHVNPEIGTLGFWLSPTREAFGVKGKDSILVEESNGRTSMKLILKADGKLKLSVSALFPKAKAGIDFASLQLKATEALAKYNLKLGNIEEQQYLDALKQIATENPLLKQSEVIEKALEMINKRPTLAPTTEEAKKLAEETKKREDEAAATAAKEEVREFTFECDELSNTAAWAPGQWHHIAIGWNNYKGLFTVNVDGQITAHVFANVGPLKRGGIGPKFTFGPGNDGLAAAVDALKVLHWQQGEDFKPDQF